VLAGNTQDSTTLKQFLDKIEKQYGKAERIWLMDRGIPTEAVLEQMRHSEPAVKYLVGTPKGRLSRLEKQLLDKPWQQARPGVEVKLLAQSDELYVLAQSADRVHKERAMRRRQLKWLWARLKKLRVMKLKREELLMKLGAAKQKAPSAWRLVDIEVDKQQAAFSYQLNKDKLRRQRRREGRYLLRTNLTESDPAKLWSLYLQLVHVEEAFKNLKGDLAIRPIFHQSEQRIEAHILVAFLAYCVQITLTERLRSLAPGLSARSVLEKFAAMQMIDVHLPTTDGREIILIRTTQPEPELKLLLDKLKLELPAQPPPKITTAQATKATVL
jgi:transposase